MSGVGEIVEVNVGDGDGVYVGETVIDGVFVIRIVDVWVIFKEEAGTGFVSLIQEDIKNINIQKVGNIE